MLTKKNPHMPFPNQVADLMNAFPEPNLDVDVAVAAAVYADMRVAPGQASRDHPMLPFQQSRTEADL
jgi:hypothetical protein